MDITERFLNYVKFDTQSAEDSESVPSTAKQLVFAQYLKKELENEGLKDVYMDEMGYIYATLPSNMKQEVPTIGFISHYDTSPDCSGKDVRPRIVEHYDGGDIVLSDESTSSFDEKTRERFFLMRIRFYFDLNCQKATAAAAATFREST